LLPRGRPVRPREPGGAPVPHDARGWHLRMRRTGVAPLASPDEADTGQARRRTVTCPGGGSLC
jgi:hypothetical protein